MNSVRPVRHRSEIKEQNPWVWNEIIRDNQYQLREPLAQEFAGRAVIDIGANTGLFSLLAAENGAKKVIAFEPHPVTFDQLSANIAEHETVMPDQKGVIEAHRLAVWKETGRVFPLIGEGGLTTLAFSGMHQKSHGPFTVESISLVDAIGRFVPPQYRQDMILKMDCEAAEYEIVMFLDLVILSHFTDIFVETHDRMHPDPSFTSDRFVKHLEGMGYIHQLCGVVGHSQVRRFYAPSRDPRRL